MAQIAATLTISLPCRRPNPDMFTTAHRPTRYIMLKFGGSSSTRSLLRDHHHDRVTGDRHDGIHAQHPPQGNQRTPRAQLHQDHLLQILCQSSLFTTQRVVGGICVFVDGETAYKL